MRDFGHLLAVEVEAEEVDHLGVMDRDEEHSGLVGRVDEPAGGCGERGRASRKDRERRSRAERLLLEIDGHFVKEQFVRRIEVAGEQEQSGGAAVRVFVQREAVHHALLDPLAADRSLQEAASTRSGL
jgi:hypothetical protein